MFLRTANLVQMAHIVYPVSSILGCTLQFIVLACNRRDTLQLLDDMHHFVNNSNYLNLDDLSMAGRCTLTFSSWIFLEDVCKEGNNIFKDAESKVSGYCKVFERLLFATWVFYVTIPAILEFQAYRHGTTVTGHTDVGLFMDL